MPKKWKGRLEDITDPENMAFAYKVARSTTKNKKKKVVRRYADENERMKLAEKVSHPDSYYPPSSHNFSLFERGCGKMREIEAPHFETKIVEHAIVSVYEQQIIKFLHPYCCASIKDRGIEKMRKRIKSFSRLPKKQRKYYVQGDIKRFFPSIRKEIAMEEYKRHIGGTRVITLIDHLMPHAIGQPLGNVLVQFTANLVLAKFDNECLKWSPHYGRHMDDFVLIFSSKRKARKFIKHIASWCVENRKLRIKDKGSCGMQIWNWEKRPLDIGGYRTTFNGVQKLRKHTLIKILRLLRKESYSLHQARSLLSLSGWVKHSSCKVLYERIQKKAGKLKHIVAIGDKAKCQDVIRQTQSA